MNTSRVESNRWGRRMTTAFRDYRAFLPPLLVLVAICVGCGGNMSGSSTTDITGQLVAADGTTLPGAKIAVIEPKGVSPDTTDPSGQFFFQLDGKVSTVTLSVPGTGTSNPTVTVADIPPATVSVTLKLSYSAALDRVTVVSASFLDSNGVPIPSTPPVGAAGGAPSPSTPVPAATATTAPPPASTTVPVPTATPHMVPPTATQAAAQGSFDSQGNTTLFGIPAGLKGNISRGASLWSANCAGCHDSKDNRTFGDVVNSYGISAMSGLNLSNAQTADLVAYLNRNN